MADPSADQMQGVPVVQWWGSGVGGCTVSTPTVYFCKAVILSSFSGLQF